jgi:hypothetical protein
VLRALVSRFGKKRREPVRALLAEPLRLVGGGTRCAVGETKQRDLEIKLGPGVSYPAPGWQTWAVNGPPGETWLLSTFFSKGALIAVEYYVAKTDKAPKYAPRTRAAFMLAPDSIRLGQSVRTLPAHFVAAAGRAGGVNSIVYQHAFDARWATGVALISGNDERIERIALYGGS